MCLPLGRDDTGTALDRDVVGGSPSALCRKGVNPVSAFAIAAPELWGRLRSSPRGIGHRGLANGGRRSLRSDTIEGGSKRELHERGNFHKPHRRSSMREVK